jgi:hypothetical protein
MTSAGKLGWPPRYAQHNFKRALQLNFRKALRKVILESLFYPENSDSTETADDDFAESPSWFK